MGCMHCFSLLAAWWAELLNHLSWKCPAYNCTCHRSAKNNNSLSARALLIQHFIPGGIMWSRHEHKKNHFTVQRILSGLVTWSILATQWQPHGRRGSVLSHCTCAHTPRNTQEFRKECTLLAASRRRVPVEGFVVVVWNIARSWT